MEEAFAVISVIVRLATDLKALLIMLVKPVFRMFFFACLNDMLKVEQLQAGGRGIAGFLGRRGCRCICGFSDLGVGLVRD